MSNNLVFGCIKSQDALAALGLYCATLLTVNLVRQQRMETRMDRMVTRMERLDGTLKELLASMQRAAAAAKEHQAQKVDSWNDVLEDE